MADAPKYIPLHEGELEKLIAFSTESREPIAGTLPLNRLIASQTGEKTIRKLAEIRGIELSS